MRVVGLDPGTDQSAFCFFDGDHILAKEILPNGDLKIILPHYRDYPLAIEHVASYGMPVGREVFETCVWIGRFIEAHGGKHIPVYRQEVKLHICKSPKANDATIHQALIDRFGPKGTKKNPGKLYGFKDDLWSALAIAVTALETKL